MKSNKILPKVLIIINIIGIFCLIYYAIPYITHDTSIANPNAMLPMERWECSGVTLTIGFIPLLVANILAFLNIEKEKIRLPIKLMFFIPSLICILLVLNFWILSFSIVVMQLM